ncbi:MAG TPA: oxygenase MpaB family protein [Plantibacter sp.]|uniref:oxygenase MpaB family protein n=1 Tax=unclassified Plantibacter TaxID=2624265 RepID=UPI002B7AFB58|nr:oxygenase MpaB family protein [Plantibacter sp.]
MVGMADLAREGILVAGAGRAILLQIADPAVAAGVARHSDFSVRPLDRLHATLTFVYALALGTPEEQQLAARRVDRAHVPVRAHSGEAAPSYSAFHADAQLWVAATLYDTAVQVYELVFGRLDETSRERLHREYAIVGTSLQLPPDRWPASRAAFDEYFSARLEELDVTAEAVEVSVQLLTARAAPAPIRAMLPLVRLVTAGLLPERLRTAYGFRWSAAQQRRFDRRVAIGRAIWPRLPRSVRAAPSAWYLRAMRARNRAEATTVAT